MAEKTNLVQDHTRTQEQTLRQRHLTFVNLIINERNYIFEDENAEIF